MYWRSGEQPGRKTSVAKFAAARPAPPSVQICSERISDAAKLNLDLSIGGRQHGVCILGIHVHSANYWAMCHSEDGGALQLNC